MKSFKQFTEMAQPRAKDREKVYYHGTGEKEAQAIIASGHLKGRDVQGKGALAPIKGHTYITPHIGYAQIYGIGGDMAGEESAHKHARSDHAYVFQISGHHLKDIHPDEDSVGEKYYETKRGKPTESGQLVYPHKSWLPDLVNRHATRKQRQDAEVGEYDSWARIGKKLNKVMADHQKHELIDAGAHIAHNGPLPVSKAWRVHKSKFHLLKRDGSNFFDHAEEVPLKGEH